MSKKKYKKNIKPVQSKVQEIPLAKQKSKKDKRLIYAIAVVVITAICYAGSLTNDFVPNWDDGGYILEYNPVHNINADNLKIIFTDFYKGNYHPLTTLFYAVEYSLVGDSPMLYHINNLIFHLLNVLLVFWFIMLLCGRVEVAAIVAVLFGVHPMHVESVAWISERKDVLYTFFFLLSLICYYFYANKKANKSKFYIFSVLLFGLSLLSKSAAVTLPVVLLLLDYYQKRKFDKKLIIDKLPFFLLSFLFGIMAILSQDKAGAIQDLTPMFSIFERLMIASYGVMIYFFKLFIPIDMSTMYPYPDRIGSMLPTAYYVAPVVVIIIFTFVLIFRKKAKDAIFGLLFFFITISLVLQLLPVGGAVLAERYTYIPYIGLFFIIGKTYVGIIDKRKNLKTILSGIIIIWIVVLTYGGMQRIKVWKTGELLFSDVIEKYPNLPFAYNNRGYYYYKYAKDNDKALKDYSKSISIDPNFQSSRSNRGVLYYNIGKYKEALIDFDKAIELRKDKSDAWIGRANTYSTLKMFDKAIPDYNTYLKLKSDDAKAYMWRGTAYFNTGKYDEALTDFNKCLEFNPNDDEAVYWKGVVYYNKNDLQASVDNLSKSLTMNPERAEAYSWRGVAYYKLKNYNESVADYTKAIQYNSKDAAAYVNRSVTYKEMHKYTEAFNDYKSAGNLGYPLDRTYFLELEKLAKQ